MRFRQKVFEGSWLQGLGGRAARCIQGFRTLTVSVFWMVKLKNCFPLLPDSHCFVVCIVLQCFLSLFVFGLDPSCFRLIFSTHR